MENIRRITTKQLKTGMYITEINDPRALDNGLATKGLVTRQETIELIRRLEIAEVYIDVGKGKDCPGSVNVSKQDLANEAKLRKARGEAQVVKQSFDDAIDKAVELRSRASELAREVMGDVKMGKGFDEDAVENIATEITKSLDSNQNAICSLMRVRAMDNYLLEHSTNVAVLIGILARGMNIKNDMLQNMVFGGFVHDIGKIRVADSILHKPGRLTPDEWEEMKRHVHYGIQALQEIEGLPRVAMEICSEHHERLDGTGYPFRLNAEKISRHGKLAAVADVYDAITADRVYHKGIEPTLALKKMLEWSGSHLDRNMVYSLVRCIGLYPAGTFVQLSSGMVAMVREINVVSSDRPTVLLVYDTNKKTRLEEQVVDLAKDDTYGNVVKSVVPAQFGLVVTDYLPV